MKNIQLFLHALPPNTPPDVPFFAAGDFNNWQPDDERFRFASKNGGCYALEIPIPSSGAMAFKITRGKWSSVECDHMGNDRPNRSVAADENAVQISVERWADLPLAPSRAEVLLLHSALPVPQLGRTRRIWAMLPPGFRDSTAPNRPVVYMLDGQNLFDNPEAIFGSWNVDKALSQLFLSAPTHADTPRLLNEAALLPVIIGIENGRQHRMDEYAPWRNEEEGGGGEGAHLLDFICHTLRPFVEKQLGIRPKRVHTGIIGSSMGGLFALYAALERPEVFGMVGVFSPALWFSPAIFDLAKKKRKSSLPQKILLMAGQKESATMVSDLLDLYENLLEAGHKDECLHYDLHSDGLHAEWFWAREFEHALNWLLGAAKNCHFRGVSSDFIQFKQHTRKRQLSVSISPHLKNPLLEIRDYCHDRQFQHPLAEHQGDISYREWEHCLYSVRLLSDNDLVFSRRLFL